MIAIHYAIIPKVSILVGVTERTLIVLHDVMGRFLLKSHSHKQMTEVTAA